MAFLLAIAGLSIAWYKAEYLGIPLVPHEKRSVYDVGAKISFEGTQKPATVSMALPIPQNGIRILSEESASDDFGFAIATTSSGKRAEWSRREVKGEQNLYYSLDVIIDPFYMTSEAEVEKSDMRGENLSDYPEPIIKAVDTLLDDVRLHSADAHSFTAQLIKEFRSKNPSQTTKMLLSKNEDSKLRLLYRLLRYEGITVRKIRGIYLEDGRRNQDLTSLLEVYDGKTWQLFDLEEGKIPKAANFFIWQRGGVSMLDVIGGKDSSIKFSVSEHRVPAGQIAKHESMMKQAALMDFSLFSLPTSQQNAFKHILLVPIGALVVVILRILIGIKTSGTFMPILIALAFMQTSLSVGLIMFLVIVGMGLVIRSYLSHLDLLLVARISAVVIVVIAIMSLMSIVSYKLGINEALTITFFPMIILAWTIERMSIIWEEEGAGEVFLQGGGSLIVAILAYFAMSNPLVAHLTFNFPELLLVVLGIVIMLGRYSGYRLSELFRFKSMV